MTGPPRRRFGKTREALNIWLVFTEPAITVDHEWHRNYRGSRQRPPGHNALDDEMNDNVLDYFLREPAA